MSLTKDIVEDSEDTIREACIGGFPPNEFDEEFVDKICRNCKYLRIDMVGHPGGASVHSVEQKRCTLDYWAEYF